MNILLLMIMLAMLMFNAGQRLKIAHLKNNVKKIYMARRASCEHSYPHRLYFFVMFFESGQ
jgi:hypothetical protein